MGHEIVAVQESPVRSWEELNLRLIAHIGHSGELILLARESAAAAPREYRLPVQDYLVRQDPPQPLVTLGITPWQPRIPAVLGQVLEGEAADKAGLQAGDEILTVNGKGIDEWMDFVNLVQASPGERLELEVARGGGRLTLALVPGTRELEDGGAIGYVGVGAEPIEWPEEFRREIRYGPVAAVGEALNRTGEMTLLTLDSIRKMLVGLISPSNLSGPITIAQISGDTARAGMESFVSFMAYLSISLAVLNLLPIPVLDGGHLLYYFVEVVRGRPVSERVQAMGLRIGLMVVGSLMVMALFFDLMRLW